MPNIAQARLDELYAAVEAADQRATRSANQATTVETKLRAFDAVLDKVVCVAEGRPLSGGGGNRSFGGGYPVSMVANYHEGCPAHPPSIEERQADEIRALNARIVDLESRIASVVAVAQFAKEHKA